MTANLEIKIIATDRITTSQQQAIESLEAECFGDVEAEAIEDDFIAQAFARILAYREDKVIGTLQIFQRQIKFENKPVNLGGLGGICVTQPERRRGVATTMLQKGLEELKKRNCDVACLNVDLDKQIYQLYQQLGFKIMDRPISFIDRQGKLKTDQGTMFVPVCSPTIFDLIMNSNQTFHYGQGYW